MRTIIRNNYTPKAGDYHERIIIDNSRHKTWLFDCDGIWTDITKIYLAEEFGDSSDIGLTQKFITEQFNATNEQIEGVREEVGDLSERVDNVEENLNIEIENRMAADEDLQANIDQVQANVEQEAADRAAAEDHLRTEIETVRESIPTKTSDLTNDSDFQTGPQVDEKIAEELAKFDHLDYKIADSVPTPTEVVIHGETVPTEPGVRYLVKHPNENRYEEYILVDGEIVDIGSTEEVNLDDYYTKAETNHLLDGKQDELIPGNNITIENNVISATATGNTHSVELTQAEYDALTPEEKMDGTVYYITDGQGGGGKTYTGQDGVIVDNTNDVIKADTNYLGHRYAPIGAIDFVGSGGDPSGVYLTVGDGAGRFSLTEETTGILFDNESGGRVTHLASTSYVDDHTSNEINDTDWSALWQ